MNEKIDKSKLTIPIYLNTKIVFDMLATIEDPGDIRYHLRCCVLSKKADND